jgi:hypothetical protein
MKRTYGIRFYPSIEEDYTQGVFVKADNYWDDAHPRFRAAYPNAIVDSHFEWEPPEGVTYPGWEYLNESN